MNLKKIAETLVLGTEAGEMVVRTFGVEVDVESFVHAAHQNFWQTSMNPEGYALWPYFEDAFRKRVAALKACPNLEEELEERWQLRPSDYLEEPRSKRPSCFP